VELLNGVRRAAAPIRAQRGDEKLRLIRQALAGIDDEYLGKRDRVRDRERKIDELQSIEFQADLPTASRKRMRGVWNADIVFLDVAVNDTVCMDLLQRHQAGPNQPQECVRALERVAQRGGVGVAGLHP